MHFILKNMIPLTGCMGKTQSTKTGTLCPYGELKRGKSIVVNVEKIHPDSSFLNQRSGVE